MRIGYPCSNLTLRESASRTFRLASYSEERLVEIVDANLNALQGYLQWNADHGIGFFRISSGTIPFASHPIMTFDWQAYYAGRFAEMGRFIANHDMRINVHPGQYTLLNAVKDDVVVASIAELAYHADLLDALGLDHTHKIQIHIGGVYGDKPAASARFVEVYQLLPESIRRRLAIENDERQYNLADNLAFHRECGVPVLFDVFHHRLFNEGETLAEALDAVIPTWQGHGPAMIDYSSQNPEKQAGAHTVSIDLDDFEPVLDELIGRDVDLMLEIKDKEHSVLRALDLVRERAPSLLAGAGIGVVVGEG